MKISIQNKTMEDDMDLIKKFLGTKPTEDGLEVKIFENYRVGNNLDLLDDETVLRRLRTAHPAKAGQPDWNEEDVKDYIAAAQTAILKGEQLSVEEWVKMGFEKGKESGSRIRDVIKNAATGAKKS